MAIYICFYKSESVTETAALADEVLRAEFGLGNVVLGESRYSKARNHCHVVLGESRYRRTNITATWSCRSIVTGGLELTATWS